MSANKWIVIEKIGKVLYDFEPKGNYQIAVKAGTRVEVLKESSGWYKGYPVGDPSTSGIFPVSFVELTDEPCTPVKKTPKTAPAAPSSEKTPTPAVARAPTASPAAAPATPAAPPAKPAKPNGNGVPGAGVVTASPNLAPAAPTPAPVAPLSPTNGSPAKPPKVTRDPSAKPSIDGAPKPPPEKPAEKPVEKVVEKPTPLSVDKSVEKISTSDEKTPTTPVRNDSKDDASRRILTPETRTNSATMSQHFKTNSLRKEDFKQPGLDRSPTSMGANDRGSFREPTAEDKTLLDEISKAMADWKVACQQHLVNGDALGYQQMKERISLILYLRRDFMDVDHGTKKREAIRQEIFQLIESARRMQGGFMVPRNSEALVADTSNTPINTLVELHNEMYDTLKKESAGLWKQKADERKMRSIKVANAAVGKTNVAELVHKDMPQGPLHLFVDVKMCLFSVGESTELHFALYTPKSGFITENYCIRLTSAGFPEDTGMLGKMKTMFSNLHIKDFQEELYLICRIFRRGRLVADSKKAGAGSRQYKRPFGCCAMSVNNLQLENSVGVEFTPPNDAMTIWMPTNEQRFSSTHEAIIDKSKDLEPAPRAKGIALGIALEAGDLTALREGDGAKYKGIVVTERTELSTPGASADPGNYRHDMYISFGHCVASQGNKTAAKNVEVMMHVVTETGEVIQNCISRGSGDAAPESSFRSWVLYHVNNPGFDELIKLQIPVDKFELCHLLFSFWHVSSSEKKNAPFSFGWLKLALENGAIIPDGQNNLLTYKPYPRMADVREITQFLEGEYLRRLPAESKQDKTTFTAHTKLCSTRKSQSPILQGVLNWAKQPPEQLQKLLTDFLTLGLDQIKEVIKVLREIFETFFNILESDGHAKLHQPAMIALLHLLSLMSADKRQKHYDHVNYYINKIFKKAGIYSRLLHLATKQMNEPTESLKNLSQCLGYIVKIATASWRLAQKLPTPPQHEDFRGQVKELLAAIVKIMSAKEEDSKTDSKNYIQSSQTYLVQTFPECIDTLREDFSGKELGQISENLCHTIPDSQRLALMKLEYLRNLMMGVVGRDVNARNEVLPILITTLRTHLRSVDQEMSMSKPYLCISILKNLMSLMQSISVEGSLDLFLGMIEDMVHAFILLQKSVKGELTFSPPEDFILLAVPLDPVVEAMGVLWILLHTVTEKKLQSFVDSMDKPRCMKFVMELLECCRRSLTLTLYPEMWIIMKFLQLTVVRKVLLICIKPIREKLPDSEVWAAYFSLAFAFVCCEEFVLETQQEKKRQFVAEKYGDLRGAVVGELVTMWKHLGAKQIQYAAQLIPTLFNLFEKPYFQTMALDMYFDMMTQEYSTVKKFNLVDLHAVDALYRKEDIAKDQGKSELFMTFLYDELKSRLDKHKDANYVKAGTNFLNHLKKMNSLMSSLLRFPDTPLFEDERTSVAIQLMNYLESSGEVRSRKAMYTRYVQFLVDLHAGLKNYVEAGMTQLTQINILDWSEDMIEASGSYPAEKERIRKERFYRSAIDYFIKGEDHERALELSNELVWYYQCYSYDYTKLGNLLQDQAGYFKSIQATERWYANYFRVVYHGEGFPEDLREKEFVCRGVKLEPVMDFVNFLRKKWPDAKIQMSSDEPTAEQRAAAKPANQIIGVTTLTRPPLEKRVELLKEQKINTTNLLPVPFVRTASVPMNTPHVPVNVRTYRENAHYLGVFEYAKGLQKSTEKKPKNEHKDLWVQKTYIFTKETFPCTRRRIEVIARKEELITPIQNAIATLIAKSAGLVEIAEKVKTAPPGPVDVGPLSMNLQGIIDAAVNGGTKLYIEAFLCDEYTQANPGDAPHIQQLKDALREQTRLLEGALEVFGRRCDEKLKALHAHLSTIYGQMKENLAAAGVFK